MIRFRALKLNMKDSATKSLDFYFKQADSNITNSTFRAHSYMPGLLNFMPKGESLTSSQRKKY